MSNVELVRETRSYQIANSIRSVAHTFYAIDYANFVNVVKYKVAKVSSTLMESEEKVIRRKSTR